MVEDVYKFLNFVRFNDLSKWDYKRYNKTGVTSSFSVEKLGKHILHEVKKKKLFDFKEESFGILGISNDVGMFDAYNETGENINQPYKYVDNGFIAYNPYRVNVGSIGIKTEKLVNSFISPAYVVISCKKTLLPEFLFILMKGDYFNLQINDSTTGSVRQTLSFSNLAEISIPLPDLATQQAIVAKYNETIALAEENERLATELEESVDKVLFEELGIEELAEASENNLYKFIKLYNLNSLVRWDVWNKKEDYISFKFKTKTLRQIITGKPLYGANEKAVKKQTDVRYLRITDINEDGSLNDEIVSAEKVEDKYLLNDNDFLIARSGNTVGKTFLYKNEFGKCLFAGYLIKFTLDTKKVLNEYVLFYTKSKIFKKWIANNQRIAGQPNINGQEYLDAPFIVPPIEIQKQIADKIFAIKEKIKQHRQKSVALCESAKKEFEEEVFSEA